MKTSFLAACAIVEPLRLPDPPRPRTPASSWAERVAARIASYGQQHSPEAVAADSALCWYYSRLRNRKERAQRAANAIAAMRHAHA